MHSVPKDTIGAIAQYSEFAFDEDEDMTFVWDTLNAWYFYPGFTICALDVLYDCFLSLLPQIALSIQAIQRIACLSPNYTHLPLPLPC